MLIKGIIFLLIFVLFISRLIPKYEEFRDTNIVSLLGVNWEGNTALLVLFAVMLVGIIVLAIALQNFYQFFTKKND